MTTDAAGEIRNPTSNGSSDQPSFPATAPSEPGSTSTPSVASEKSSFTPAPPPKVNIWKQRQQSKSGRHPGPAVVTSHAAEPSPPVSRGAVNHATGNPFEPQEPVDRAGSVDAKPQPKETIWKKSDFPVPAPIPARAARQSPPTSTSTSEQAIDPNNWPTPEGSAVKKDGDERRPSAGSTAATAPVSSGLTGTKPKWVAITPTIVHNNPLPTKSTARNRPVRGRGAPPEDGRGRVNGTREGRADARGEGRGRARRAGSVGSNVPRERQGKNHPFSPVFPGEQSEGERNGSGDDPGYQQSAGMRQHRGSHGNRRPSNFSAQTSPNVPNAGLFPYPMLMNEAPYHAARHSISYQPRYPQFYDYQLQLQMGYGMYDPNLQQISILQGQMDYYFSEQNLLGDMFLRRNMDSMGFVPLRLIMDFPRMKALSANFQLLQAACIQSFVVELLQVPDGDDRVRKAEAWEAWVLDLDQRDQAARNDGPGGARERLQEQQYARRMNFTTPQFMPAPGYPMMNDYHEFDPQYAPQQNSSAATVETAEEKDPAGRASTLTHSPSPQDLQEKAGSNMTNGHTATNALPAGGSINGVAA